jgi:hypothetical protein
MAPSTLFPRLGTVKLKARRTRLRLKAVRALAARSRLMVLLASAMACNEGLAPRGTAHGSPCPSSFQGICGTVTFRGALPESTDVVYVVAYKTFPKTLSDLFTFSPLTPPALFLDDVSRANPQPFTLPLPDTTYEWVLAAWKKQGTLTPQNADSLLREAGYYRNPADTTKPGVVVVQGKTTGVDFVVDFTNMHPVSYYFP